MEPQSAMSTSIVQLLVRQPQQLDFEEKQQMILQVRKVRNRPRVCDNNISPVFHTYYICHICSCARVTMQVIAVDQEKPSFLSTATVTINIKDTNDHSPKFPQDTYKLKVAEHSDVGTIVANITVSPLLSGFLQFELGCKKLLNGTQRSCVSFPRLRILTRWIKATSPTDFFQTACMSTLDPVIFFICCRAN